MGLVYGFVAGADFLEDLDVFAEDAGFAAAAGPMISSNRYSEFLAAFDARHLRGLQNVLIKTSLAMRRMTHGLGNFHLIIDSTKHEQYGLKQEGVEFSYTKYRCLDSLQAYDEHGYSYWHAVRPGVTHTSVGATEVISAVLSQLHAGNDYDYAAFVTNLGMHEMKATDVLRKYRKRSNAENFVRGLKNGIDTRRFPCRRLVSNCAFELAAAFAHTIIRCMAQVSDKTLVTLRKEIAEPPDPLAVHGLGAPVASTRAR